jgi:3-isopropylmalate dehydrogenase
MSYPNIPNLSPSVDLVIIRENTEDVYLGWEFDADENTVVALRVTSEKASRRIAEYGFKAAMLRNKKKRVVIVHKANVLPKGDGLFARTCKSIAQNYPEITCSESYVDTCAMNLIRNPEEFDVILTTNLYGDILSDEAAQVVGGLGLGPSANIGESFALFEPVHGAAFDIAGKDIANPSSILLSVKMMLEWLADKYDDRGALREGQRIESAMIGLLRKNRKTKDIGGKLTTTDFTKLLSLSMY